MKRNCLLLALVFLLLSLPLGSASAQATTGAISGVVTDTQGKPIAGIDVQALNFDTFEFVGSERTNEKGAYELAVPPGTYLVCINTNFYEGSFVSQAFDNVNSWSRISKATPVKVASGQRVSGVDFELLTGHTVSGKLVDTEGKPVPAGGWIGDLLTGVSMAGALGGFGSDETGRFRVNVLPGTYDLSFDEVIVARWIPVTKDLDLGTIVHTPIRAEFNPKTAEGYTASPFIPSKGITAPFDVAVAPGGDIYVASARRGVLRVTPEGEITVVAELKAYAVDVDTQGNVYAFDGDVHQITPAGQVTTLATLPVTAMLCRLAVGPAGDIYVSYEGFTGDRPGPNHLIKVTGDGRVTRLIENLPDRIDALAFDSQDQLFALIRQKIVKVSLDSGAVTPLIEVQSEMPACDIALDAHGNFFVSTGGMDERGELFKVTPDGKVTRLASIPENGLLGIAATASGEIIGVQKNIGALVRVLPDGSVTTVIPGSGLTTPHAIAFSPHGDLFISNDEAEMVTRATSQGQISNFVKLRTFGPPWDSIAFERSGAFYHSEGMPGFPSRLLKVSPEGDVSVVSEQFDRPAGLAFDDKGNLFVAEYMKGKIWYITPDGAIETFATGLGYPESIAFGPGGDLFVTVGYLAGDPEHADTIRTGIVKVSPDGTVAPFVDLPDVQYIAVSPAGDLFATTYGGIVCKIEPDGKVSLFASGFLAPMGLAFDVSGDLFVADETRSSVTRITGFPAGNLRLSVKDANTGRGIQGATVSVVIEANLVVGTTGITDANGSYSLRVAPGSYTVSAAISGYRDQFQGGISVMANESRAAELLLEPLSAAPAPAPAPSPAPAPGSGGLSCARSPGSQSSVSGDLVLFLGMTVICFAVVRFRRR